MPQKKKEAEHSKVTIILLNGFEEVKEALYLGEENCCQ